MASQKQDYILRQIELLRQFVSRVIGSGNGDGLEQALQETLHLQEKLFAMPPAEFLRQTVDGQVATLQRGESKAAGQAKCVAYAALLQETSRLYQFRGRDDLAAGARQLALHVALQVALDEPADPVAAPALIRELLAAGVPEQLPAPVREMLDRFVRQSED